jgi:DNA-directed RNA polymerase subunit E'/Rpb7
MQNVLTRKVDIEFNNVGKNIKELLQKKLVQVMEGKCVIEGYIKPDSVRVINYSAGQLISSNVQFTVVFECLLCNPVENQLVKVKALNITKAGIRAEAVTKGESPLDVFIARDHNYKNKQFSTIKEDDEFTIRIIGQRYEINDPVISVLGELVKPRTGKPKPKPKLVIKRD